MFLLSETKPTTAAAHLAAATAFGERLLATRDLDPVYCAIVGAGVELQQLRRLLVAYLCFYHLGVACWLSEKDEDFWEAMLLAGENRVSPQKFGLSLSRWPRGTERRHFRGQQCVEALTVLSSRSPGDLLKSLTAKAASLRAVREEMLMWPMFGEWAAFKAADLLERVVGLPVTFPVGIFDWYKEPRAGLALLPEGSLPVLLKHFARFRAPPRLDRRCGLQEIETILCKYKSSMGGHYHVGKDIAEVRHALEHWGSTASRLLRACPRIVV